MRQAIYCFVWFAFVLSGCSQPSPTSTVPPPAYPILSPTNAATPLRTPALADCISPQRRMDHAIVKNVLSGDSITAEIAGVPFTIRYLGIESPDAALDPSGAEAALAQNRSWVASRAITLLRDVSEVDGLGRLLRYVYVDAVFVNEELLRGGFVRLNLPGPDQACEREFTEAERAAQSMRAGIWRVTALERTKTKAAACTGACLTPSPGCRIKGNINSKGEKIYHVPGARGYAQTIIEIGKGERWFCSEEEAQAAGWRKG
jgi:micrococcal nuclease